MKKIIKLLLTLLTVLCLCACGGKQEKNELASLYEKGYETTMSSLTEEKWYGLLQKDYSFEDIYKVEISIDQNTYNKLFEIDTFEEAGAKKFNEILTTIQDCKVTPMADKVPNKDDFSIYIGKTIQDLENDGYERSGYFFDEEGCVFFADGPDYSINVQVNEVITDVSIDDYSENDIRALTIKDIKFSNFSFNIFD